MVAFNRRAGSLVLPSMPSVCSPTCTSLAIYRKLLLPCGNSIQLVTAASLLWLQRIPYGDGNGRLGVTSVVNRGPQCLICGRRYTRTDRLKRHMIIHTGEQPYQCQVCGRRFNQRSNMISHMKKHNRTYSKTSF